MNLERIDFLFQDGDLVNRESLMARGILPKKGRLPGGIKILGKGEITKRVVIEANFFSKGAVRKLEEKGIEFKVL